MASPAARSFTLVLLVAQAAACGRSGSGTSARKDAAVATADAASLSIAARPLGMAEVAGFAYRTRGGHEAFRRAREFEAAGDWAAVAKQCEAALAADATHLDAAYLLAVARAKTGDLERVLEPLAHAVTGDFAKWGQAGLEQPALQKFLATPIGVAWRARVEQDRERFLAGLARSLVVTSAGDLFAYDPEGPRWYRLTRTAGAVVAALPVRSAQRIAYVTRERVTEAGKPHTKVGIGIVDLAIGRMRRAVYLPTSGALRVAYNERKLKRFVVRSGKQDWYAVDEDNKLKLVAMQAKQAGAPTQFAELAWLDVTGRTARLTRLGVDGVSADWDEQTLASAIKLATTARVISAPSGLVDGNTATWSPDRSQLAFVAQLADDCKPGVATAAAFIADAATGKVDELARSTTGIAIEWLANRRLAIAGDAGVTVHELGNGEPITLVGADGLATPRRQPQQCTPDAPQVADPPAAPDDDPVSDEIPDAGLPP